MKAISHQPSAFSNEIGTLNEEIRENTMLTNENISVGAQLRCAIRHAIAFRAKSPSVTGLLHLQGTAVVLAALFFAPQAALAINECDPVGVDPAASPGDDTFTCDPNDDFSLTGITYTSDGALILEVPNVGRRGPDLDVGDVGINATAGNDADNLFWDSSQYAPRRSSIHGTDGPVIDYRSIDGRIDIHTGGQVKGQADGDSQATHAILAEATGGGGIGVTVEGSVNANRRGFPSGFGTGIEALTTTGDITIDVTGGGTAVNAGSGGQYGIHAASSSGGDIAINTGVALQGSVVNTGSDATHGILAETTTGDIAISGGELSGFQIGAGVVMGNSATHGIRAETVSGKISLSASLVNPGAGATHGVLAESVSGDIDLLAGSLFGTSVNAAQGIGVMARTDTGAIRVFGGIVESAGETFILGANVTALGDATHAILAESTGGSDITIRPANVSASSDAVGIETRTDGLATINIGGLLGTGVSRTTASATSDIAIRSSGNRVVVNGVNPSPPTEFPIDLTGLPGIRGAVDFADLSGGAEINLGGGTLWSLGAGFPSTTSRFSDVADVVNIDAGAFLSTPLVSPATDDVDTATVRFGEGDDIVNNSGELLVGPNFVGSGFDDEFYESELRFEGLETFNNTGTIRLGAARGRNSGLSANTDQNADDMLVLQNTDFHGEAEAGSRLLLDANLSKAGQATACDAGQRGADGSLPVADCLKIAGGTATGRTLVEVRDLDPVANRGIYNPDGTLLVDLTSNDPLFSSDPEDTDPEAFVLGPENEGYSPTQGGIIDRGLFFYTIAYDPSLHQFRLYGLPGTAAQQIPLLAHASNDLWRTATDAWFERRVDQRDVDVGEGRGGGLWMRAGYRDADRDVTTPLIAGGETLEFDNSYTQTDKTVTFGYDLDFRGVGGGDWVAGAMLGYGRAELEYDAMDNTANLEGMHGGFYGSFVTGAFYVDAALNYQWLEYDNDVPALNLTPETAELTTDGNVFGARVEAGWRWRYGRLEVEPLAGLHYSRASIDNLDIPGIDPLFFEGEADTEDTVSSRGSLGVRVSMSDLLPGIVPLEVGLTARGIEEFDGEGEVSIANNGPLDAPVSDEYDGTFGQATADVSITNVAKTVAGYLRVDGTYGDDYDSVSGSIGFRYQW